MNNCFVVVCCLVFLTACQSTHKLPIPKGKWVAVNESGFVPPNTTKYRQLTQDEQEQTQMGDAQ